MLLAARYDPALKILQSEAAMAQNDAPLNAEAPEVIEVDTEIVSCDGGGGALGHPKVWLNMKGRGWVECGYCDRRFVLRTKS